LLLSAAYAEHMHSIAELPAVQEVRFCPFDGSILVHQLCPDCAADGFMFRVPAGVRNHA
jgi:hypothetical protein